MPLESNLKNLEKTFVGIMYHKSWITIIIIFLYAGTPQAVHSC